MTKGAAKEGMMKSRMEFEIRDNSNPFSVSESCASAEGGEGDGVGVLAAFLLEARVALCRGFLPGGIEKSGSKKTIGLNHC